VTRQDERYAAAGALLAATADLARRHLPLGRLIADLVETLSHAALFGPAHGAPLDSAGPQAVLPSAASAV
jgi:hypothetical protein